ncbi:glutamine amidotransferase [Snodgrassella sp. CFCC 13594]|uniref:glutamine amidotransferase n=1 Tax=Snodgrassella sp. CFCC 13594 TaxID=1775559 RepID=UPI00082F5925|nr:glutamine amidotransferase [Snodgrassella sp. CFCC 13594]
MAHIAAIRHVGFENMGILETVLHQRQHSFHYIDAPLGHFADAAPEHHDLLVILGGPIGAFEEAAYPFLRNELALLQAWLQCGKPILGICLGAQLLARLMGAAVTPMPHKEIGYAPLILSVQGHASPLRHLNNTPVLHWHGDCFALPEGTTSLASSELCSHQAFAKGKNILALQFHLEALPEQIEYWLVGHACELAQAQIPPPRIRQQATQYGEALTRAAASTLNEWLDGCLTSGKPPTH